MDSFPARLSLCLGLLGRRHDVRGQAQRRSKMRRVYMSAELDALIRKAHNLGGQIEQLTTELRRLRDAIAAQMGEEREYYGQGVVAKKWTRVRWEINKALLLDELPPEALAYLKEVVFTKDKLDQALRAGHLRRASTTGP